MKKLSKIAKNIDNLAVGAFWTCVVFGVILSIVTVAGVFVGEEFFENASQSIILGSVSFDIAEGGLPDAGYVKSRFVCGMIMVLCILVFTCCVVKIIRRILKPMKEEKPFDCAVSENLRKLSFITLIGGAVLSVGKVVFEAILFKAYDIPGLFLSDKITGCNIDYVLDVNFIAGFAILYLLSYVFRYGEELQQQADETL